MFRMGKQEGMCFAVEHPEGLFVLDARVGRHVGRGCGRASGMACLMWEGILDGMPEGMLALEGMWRGTLFWEGHVEGHAFSGR